MRKGVACLVAVLFSAGLLALFNASSTVQAAEGEFNLQVSPSPMVLTLKPGETTTHELKIRNTGTQVEQLRIDPRNFSMGNNGEVKLDDTKKPLDISDWTNFSAQEFTVQPGETYTEKIIFNTPESAGFSYSFSFVITRQDVSPALSEQKLQGKVALFCLVTIDKPGATRTLEIQELKADQAIYEYLPAKFNITFKNTGNTIVRPAGTVFMQRGSNDQVPIDSLPVNASEGYILPGSARVLSVDWRDGFPAARATTDATGATHENVEWNWSNLSHLRIGRYTAKVVAIYNDGQRDIPLIKEVSFWVIPWKLLLGMVVIVVLLGFGVWSIASKFFGRVKRKSGVGFSKRN